MEKNKKMIIHEFYPEIYPVLFWVIENPNVKQLYESFSYHDDTIQEIREFNKDGVALTFQLMIKNDTLKYGVVVTLNRPKDLKPWSMAHEACHVSNFIYNYIGADEVDLGGEPHAYFIEWITKCIYEVVNETKNKNMNKLKCGGKKPPIKK